MYISIYRYGVALVSRIDKNIGLFCKRALQNRRYSAKETCDFIDPTDRSHPIPESECIYTYMFILYIRIYVYISIYRYEHVCIYTGIDNTNL